MKRYTIEYGSTAGRKLDKIKDVRIFAPIKGAIAELGENPRPPGCLKMSGKDNEWRIRVGDWWVVYRIDDGRVVVIAVRVAPRGGAYR